jgi:hypothetical protein
VKRPEGDTVRFVDGTIERIDAIIYCTGYKISLPFLDPTIIAAHDNNIALFHRVVEPDHAGLYFIGLVQPLGAIMPLAEAQSEWVAGPVAWKGPASTQRRGSAGKYRGTSPKAASATWPPSGTPSRSTSSLT